MNNNEIIVLTDAYVHAELGGEATGHDYWHGVRVSNLAARIAKEEGADLFVVQLAALQHDIGDEKFSGDPLAGPNAARTWLTSLDVAEGTIRSVCDIIGAMSFKGAGVDDVEMTLEGRCVRDADRLDALGAIGIARTFAYGGKVGSPIHEPAEAVVMANTSGEYRSHRGTTINHFYEKLFLLADRMTTTSGRRMARERHDYMVNFVDRFLSEWSGDI